MTTPHIIMATLPVAVMPTSEVSQMPRERIAGSEVNGQSFEVFRDPLGIRFQIIAGDTSATFQLFDFFSALAREITSVSANHRR
ncbi:MAG: hypothetical protein EP336_09630 [Rhodobacteraceae bacterium]|nr:MAG: hypothetical protein EP336_09630 [Paracoccaceae bacterium]